MGLPQLAEKFAQAGFVVSLFDYRYLGASEGEPRGQILPKDFLAAPDLTAAVYANAMEPKSLTMSEGWSL